MQLLLMPLLLVPLLLVLLLTVRLQTRVTAAVMLPAPILSTSMQAAKAAAVLPAWRTMLL